MAKNRPPYISSATWESTPPNFLALSPLDGRNYHKLQALVPFFSDFALTKMRLKIEIEYIIFLSKIKLAPYLNQNQTRLLTKIYADFDLTQANHIRSIEHQTNHDIKAIEYYLKDELNHLKLAAAIPYLHWALTSEDVNNLAYSLLLKNYSESILQPLIKNSLKQLSSLIKTCHYPMLGLTHGQPAAVTTLAKELSVYLSRAITEFTLINTMEFQGKINGAVGSLSDQTFAAPNFNWPKHLTRFIKLLGLSPNLTTTQILPYESYLYLFDTLSRLQNIAIDLCQNCWWYLHFGYFNQKSSHQEIGSSVMPQKINPIYFEGAEGGFEISNALLNFYHQKLSRSRLQRDLSDSTVRRSFGIAFTYSYLSWQSLTEAIKRLSVNPNNLHSQLESHYEILGSALQTYLRLNGFAEAYESVSKQIKGKTMNRADWLALLASLPLKPKNLNYCTQHLNFATLAQPADLIARQVLTKITL